MYTQFKTELGTVVKNATPGPLPGIEPAALQFQCSTLTN